MVEAFKAFDADNDGFITTSELGGLLASLGHNTSEQDVRAMMQQGDTNRDGLLGIEEFLEMSTKDMELGGLANCLRSAFETLNGDGEESVTAEELFEVLRNLGAELSWESCKDIIASVDGDGDGVVSFEDFKLIVNSLL
ncbi:EF_hand_5 domain-containing protein [Cephalotus follicularis]|uniref:EF_hand_5 domain-containing protein n=1 Tax=Cephalotus follicularis TaxID=3775 RepID=A0A1Q3C7F9_CEPFO|nr:EF_hand_5 domain-containing protein [Cephalotus follicularis]